MSFENTPAPKPESGTRPRRILWISLSFVLLIVAFIVMEIIEVRTAFRESEPYQEAISWAISDPELIAALGDPVELGAVSGSLKEASFRNGYARFEVKLKGAVADGTLYIVGDKPTDSWLTGYTLQVDDTGVFITPESFPSMGEEDRRIALSTLGEMAQPLSEESKANRLVARVFGAVFFGIIGITLASIALSGSILYVISMGITRAEPYQAAMTAAEKNSGVVAALGLPIKASSLIIGKMKRESANLCIPIRGSLGKGAIVVEAWKQDGVWQYETLAVRVDGSDEAITLTR